MSEINSVRRREQECKTVKRLLELQSFGRSIFQVAVSVRLPAAGRRLTLDGGMLA
jgi:hypothetical protein